MSTPSKRSIYIIGATILTIGAILIFRYLKGHNRSAYKDNPDSIPNTAAAEPIKAIQVTSTFPLKIGSRNSLVKQLQIALGISADGIFGVKTQAALLAQTGKTSISTQTEYNTIIKQLQSKPAIAANKARADMLTNQWAGNSLQLMAISKNTAIGVVKDVYGALVPTGKNMTLAVNNKLARKDFQPSGSTTAGYLLINVLNGDLKGLYKADPNQITLA